MLPQTNHATMCLPILIILSAFFAISCSYLLTHLNKNDRKLPPGPKALPVIGNLHMLGSLPHQKLANLAKKYGPLMSIRLGSVPAIVASSPRISELMLKTHDVTFANRPVTQASIYMSYGNKGVAFTKYGSYWRSVRKLCNAHVLSVTRAESFAPLRIKELKSLVDSIKKFATAGEVVDMTEKVGELMESITFKMILGQDKDDKFNLKALIEDAMYLSGAFNVSDFVPWLGPLDLQGLKRRMKAVSKSVDELYEKIIHEQAKDARVDQRHGHRDFINILVSLINQSINSNNESGYTIDRTNVKAILLDMVLGAFETSATSIVWIFTELLRHPLVMKRLQEELERVIGMKSIVEEGHLAKLTYLDFVVKESFRLHPAVPLLIPRESTEDVTIDGYVIPKKSRIMINIWAIGRDPNIWSSNVNEFLPERFAGSKMDFGGHDFRFLPFGSGRRGCPGMHLGLTTIKLVVAQLVHCFNWELPNGMLPCDLDTKETFGLTLLRATHLLVVPTSFRLQN